MGIFNRLQVSELKKEARLFATHSFVIGIDAEPEAKTRLTQRLLILVFVVLKLFYRLIKCQKTKRKKQNILLLKFTW
jgi:hypothetical protein